MGPGLSRGVLDADVGSGDQVGVIAADHQVRLRDMFEVGSSHLSSRLKEQMVELLSVLGNRADGELFSEEWTHWLPAGNLDA
ncbi:MAG: hypothetical protein ACJAR2_002793 [Ilumatobacter sp.]|jgi:hypothetical protein